MRVSQESALAQQTVPFERVTQPLQRHLGRLSEFIFQQTHDFDPEARKRLTYVIDYPGKRLRPILVFYSGWTETVSEELVRIAAVVELIHIATLVHDDLLDRAKIRHSRFTSFQKYGSDISILLGNMLFAQSLKLTAESLSNDMCQILSHAALQICSGELNQLLQRGNAAIQLDDYYRIILLKTAKLFEIASRLGAQSTHTDEAYREAAATFGRQFGMAYQIFDDWIDCVGNESHTGKTLGTDQVNGKFTLPILLLLQKLNASQRRSFLKTMGQPDKQGAPSLSSLLKEHCIFEEVKTHFEHTLAVGEAALASFQNQPSVPYLQTVSAFIRGKMVNSSC